MPQAETSQVQPPQRTFVGREREMAELCAGLEVPASDRRRVFLISGEPGIGKTRLAEEFASYAASRGTRVVWGRCWEGGGVPAYWPWIQVLRTLLADSNLKLPNISASAELAQLMPELRVASENPNAAATSARFDPEQARFRLFDSVTSLVKDAARLHPLMLVLDDLHDADQPSLLMLQFVARELGGSRVILVGAYREIELRRSPALSKLLGEILRDGHQLPLAGLSREEVARMIECYSGEAPASGLVSELHRATLGNPLFVDGVVRMLSAEGRLHEGLDLAHLKLPDGAREAIRRRLGLLSAEAHSTLTVAAFVGQEFDAHVLERVAELAAERLSDIVQEGLDLAVLTQPNPRRYRFAHPLIREALYQHPPAAERIRLHRRIGETLEQLYRTDLRPHLAALAYHFRESSIADKAIDYSIRAGEAAEAVFAYDDALSHLRSALPIAEAHDDHDLQRAGVLLRLGRIEVFFENRDQGVEHLEIALKMYEQIGDDQHAGEIHSHLGRLFGAFGPQENVARALVHLQRAELLLGQTGESFALGLVYWGLGYTNIEALRINEALMASQKGMDIFARLGERERWARVAGNHAHCLMVKGKLAPAVALLDEIAGAATGFVNPDAYLLVIGCCGWFRLLMKDPKEAAHFYRLGLDRSGFQLNIRPFMLEFLTLSELLMGNLAEAKRLAAENRVNDIFRSRIALYEGDWKAAEEKLERALDWAQTADTKWNQLITLGNMVPLLRVAGDYERATAAFERARSLYPPDDLFLELGMRSQAVMLCVDSGRPERAAEHLECCRRILAEQEDWLGIAGPVWRAEGIVAALQGRSQESDEHFAKAIENHRQYSLPWDEAETLHYWGRALLRAGQLHRAQERLDAAIKIYRDHGAGQCWIDRVEADQRQAQPLRIERDASTAGAIDLRQPRSTGPDEGVFRKEGDFWTITYGGRTFRLHDMKGLAYIAHLLAHPGERIHVHDLLATVEGTAAGDGRIRMAAGPARQDGLEVVRELGDAGEALDLRARGEYRRRLGELRAELEDAEGQSDPGRANRARTELEFLTAELAAAVGRGGRGRKIAAHAERARATVTKSIRASLERIGRNDVKLGHHFATCIRTGYLCAYLPDPERKPFWRI